MDRASRSRRELAAQAQAAAQAELLARIYRVAGLVLLVLTLLGILWLARHVHPDFATAVAPVAPISASAPSAPSSAAPSVAEDLTGRLEQTVHNDVRADALEGVTFIRRSYSIPENALIARLTHPAATPESEIVSLLVPFCSRSVSQIAAPAPQDSISTITSPLTYVLSQPTRVLNESHSV